MSQSPGRNDSFVNFNAFNVQSVSVEVREQSSLPISLSSVRRLPSSVVCPRVNQEPVLHMSLLHWKLKVPDRSAVHVWLAGWNTSRQFDLARTKCCHAETMQITWRKSHYWDLLDDLYRRSGTLTYIF